MAFPAVQIRSLRNGATSISGPREDLAQGDVITLDLTDVTGISTFEWRIMGRPEYSTAGGSGPNPWILSTGSSASFVVDTDALVNRDGTYVIHCVVNSGAPSKTTFTTILSRMVIGLTIPAFPSGTRGLRKLGVFESLEDTNAVSGVIAGWATQMNRWLDLLINVAGGAVGGGAPSTASYLTLAYNGTLTAERVLTAGTGITLTDNGAGSTLVVSATSTTTIAAGQVAYGTATNVVGGSANLTWNNTNGWLTLKSLNAALNISVNPTTEIVDFDFNNFQSLLGSTIATPGRAIRFNAASGQVPISFHTRAAGVAYPGTSEALRMSIDDAGALMLYSGASGVSAATGGGFRFNNTTNKLQWAQSGSAWANFDAFTTTIAAGQVAYGTATNVVGGSTKFLWNDTIGALTLGDATVSAHILGLRSTFITAYTSDGLFGTNARPAITVATANNNSSLMLGYDDTGGTAYYQSAIGFDGTTAGINLGLPILRVRARTEANDRFSIGSNGAHQWGVGGATTFAAGGASLAYSTNRLVFNGSNGTALTERMALQNDGALLLSNGSTGAASAARGGFKYNESTNKLQWSQNNSAWANFDAFATGGPITLAVNQVAYGTATNTVGGSASLTWDNTNLVFKAGATRLAPYAQRVAFTGADLQVLGVLGTVTSRFIIGNGGWQLNMSSIDAGLSVVDRFSFDDRGSLLFANGSTAPALSTTGGWRYNESTNKLQWAQNASAWANLDAFAIGTISITTGQVAYGTATNTLGGNAALTLDPVAAFGPGADAPTTVPLLALAGRMTINTPTLAYTTGTVFNANQIDVSFTPTSGAVSLQALRLNYTVNRIGTGGSIGLRIACTETAKGSGTNYLLYMSSGTATCAFDSSGGLVLQGGSTATSYGSAGGLRYNESTNKLQWAQNSSAWVNFDATAPASATYWTATADATLTNEVALGALATGLVKNTTTTGIPTIAVAGTDYLAPSAISIAINQVAYATAANVIGGAATFKWDNTNTRLGVGQATPLYTLDVAGGNAPQIHFGNGTADSGAYLMSTAANDAYITAGAGFNGTSWVAKATTATMLQQASGSFVFRSNAGLTVAGTFTPTDVATFTAAGALTLANGTSNVSLDSSAGTLTHIFSGEANPRYQISRAGIAAGQSAITFGPGGASTLAITGAAIGLAGTAQLGAYVSNGTALTQVTRWDISSSRFRQVFGQATSHITFGASTILAPGTNFDGWRIMAYEGASASASWGIGMESAHMWLHNGSASGGFKFYTTGTEVARLNNAGFLALGGSYIPLYPLVAYNSSDLCSINFRGSLNGSDDGGFLGSIDPADAYLGAGVKYLTSVGWKARATTPTLIDMLSGTITLYTDTAQTVGSTYGPTTRATFGTSISLGGVGSFGSGVGMLFIKDRTTAPTTNPTGGSLLFSEAGGFFSRSLNGFDRCLSSPGQVNGTDSKIAKRTSVLATGTYADDGLSVTTTVDIIQIDLSSYNGYNYGNTAKEAIGVFDLLVAGVSGSGGTLPLDRQQVRCKIHVHRENAGTPVVTSFADATNVGAVVVDISGTVLRIRATTTSTITAENAWFAELRGVLLDFTP